MLCFPLSCSHVISNVGQVYGGLRKHYESFSDSVQWRWPDILQPFSGIIHHTALPRVQVSQWKIYMSQSLQRVLSNSQPRHSTTLFLSVVFLPHCHLSFLSLVLVTIPKCRTSCFLVFHKWTQILSTDVWWMKLRNENCLICTLKMCCIREIMIGMNTNAVAEQKNNFFFINKSFYLIQTQSLYSLLINYQSNLSYEQFYSLLGSGNSSECSFGQTWPGPKAKSNSELH